ncbi:piggyBac transposable element-derived protein 4-like [Phymastichus coffea]|uniref:piggyBac transposable element-derived protein 4-like n=1 Tax=Phymastichus coffea TaxID=108790 RepID=UPI00273C9381|nr:piggyBac transposable element-derived protein 4-like [Phymastichus coffea]
MGKNKNVVTTEIPSDSDSVDGLQDSDNEEDVVNSRSLLDENISTVNNNDDEEESMDAEDIDDSNQSDIWKSVSRPRSDFMFSKSFGPNIPDTAKSPLDIFSCLFSSDLLDHIVHQTNLFFLSHMHVNDNSKEPEKGDPNYDKLYKVRPLLDELSRTFKESFNLGKHQSVDVSLIKFKGRSIMKQYMSAKPIKRGYKCWTRADESGYVCQFQIYTGKADNTEKQLGTRVVKDLTRELVDGNHHVYFDNFFTGVEHLSSLKEDKINACGTVRQNRSGLPTNINDKKSKKKMDIGEYEFMTAKTGPTWIKWMDKKPVYFLFNFHDASEVTTINHYNKDMGYLDYADRLISVYKIDRKSKKWWFRIFWHFLDLTISNAYILYREKHIKPTLNLKKFRLNLVEQMVGHKIPTAKGRKRKYDHSEDFRYQKPQVSLEKRRNQAAHMPVSIQSAKRCVYCSIRKDQRRIKWKCMTCDVPLCLLQDRNCFQNHHT